MDTSYQDKFGYYQVGTLKSYSKVEAIELQALTKQPLSWVFNETVFGNYDWRVEPLETLEELYAKRAREIREKYDYITLFYSGGADSGNVLNTFVNNGIPFEEIATINYHKLDPREDSFFHAEQVKVSYPRIRELQTQGVVFKHKPIDLTDITHSILTDTSLSNNLAYYSNMSFGITHLAVSYIRERDPDYLRLQEQGKKHAFVWAIEKPRVYIDQGRYCFKFVDMIDNGPSTRTQILGRPHEYDELFYWDPSCTDLLCKQGHTIMRFLKRNRELALLNGEIRDNEKKFRVLDIETSFCNDATSDGLTYREILNWLVYPGYNPYMFSMGKPVSSVYSLRDEYWLKDRVFQKSLFLCVEHLSRLDANWHYAPGNIRRGLKFLSSPSYFLE